MAKVYEFLAEGFEEIEALAPVDILRRGGVDVQTVSVTGSLEVVSSHGVTVKADLLIEEVGDCSDADLLVLPGGSVKLNDSQRLKEIIALHNGKGKTIGAICAAPMVLGTMGLLNGRRATCYPGFEGYLEGAEYTRELITVDGNIITAEGPAVSLSFGYKLLSLFVPENEVKAVEDGMRFTHLMEKA